MLQLIRHSFLLSLFLLLSSCQVVNHSVETINITTDIIKSTLSVIFSSADNRLWRLLPTKNAVYVDFSTNYGKTYSSPVRVNPRNQKISAWPENPPVINISHSGRINILYYADEQQKSTSYFSYSDDNGKTFSPPTLISNQAKSYMHYMDKMLIDHTDNIYFFWHDTRHEQHNNQGEGVLSLYYSLIRPTDSQKSFISNQFINAGICSCCRTAATLTTQGTPVILARMVLENGIRDHALIIMNKEGTWGEPQRVTYDNWVIEGCPEHGPSITIDNENRTHFSWFTLGDTRQGIFYANTDDYGKTVSKPLALGNIDKLPSHPDIISLNQRVVIAWKEFDGEQTTLHIQESLDRGNSWTKILKNLSSKTKSSHPQLITNNKDIFLSWASEDNGHQLILL